MVSIARVLLFCLMLAIAPAARSTAQISDVLIVDGQRFSLNTNPLESQIEQKKWEPPKEAIRSTANWRGYVATWLVKENRLLLKEVTIRVNGGDDPRQDRQRNIIRDLYPGAFEVFAEWYTGALIVPDGEMTQYVHMGYGSSFDHYQILRVRNGKVIERLSLTGAEFEAYKEKKFAEFRKTEAFKRAYADVCKGEDGMDEQEAIDFIQAYFSETYLSQ